MTEPRFTITDIDFHQESLDFSSLSPADFENLVFHLADEMGFTNLIWRKGGEGNSATDGGRDLEASYWRVEPIESVRQIYWFEVKFRKGQLERSQVQKAVLDASASNSVDHLVIVTNSTVSNPCLDWLKEFRKKHSRPSVSVWQGHDLELLLRKNPRTLARFIPTALTFRGRCKVIESRLSNLFLLPAVDELSDIWDRQDELEDEVFVLLAAVLSEAAYGDLVTRPWGMSLPLETLVALAASAVVNIYPFIFRIGQLDRSQEPLIEGVAYLISCVLQRESCELAARLLYNPEEFFELDTELPEELKVARCRPVLATLYDQLACSCSAKACYKLHYRDPHERDDFFGRFREPEKRKEQDERFLMMNSNQRECKLGLVPMDQYCPLGEDIEDEFSWDYVAERLQFAQAVLRRRVAELADEQ